MGPEWAACGVFGGGARAWECINTAHDLESCKYDGGFVSAGAADTDFARVQVEGACYL
jgi:hypothetical protein